MGIDKSIAAQVLNGLIHVVHRLEVIHDEQTAFSRGKGTDPTLEIGDPAARVIAEMDV